NRYVTDETFTKRFVRGGKERAEHREEYQEKGEENRKDGEVLLRYKTRRIMKHVTARPIEELEPAIWRAVMDHITVYEDGRLQIKFYDGTEFEVATE
ncbi:hypothetical protein AAGC94_18300, partial [Clostridium sporogenes]|uniref:hypothetical protein n=1 Tax=Bacteria TaxID=2 RepID=UPI00313ACBE0